MKKIFISLMTMCIFAAAPPVLEAGQPPAGGDVYESPKTIVDESKYDTYLGAAVLKERKEIERTGERLEMISPLSHDEIVKIYEGIYGDNKDVKFRRWEDSTYIEDDGALKWHSITIDREYDDGTRVTIVKDNWTWIISTLVLRFIAVFIVLSILFFFLSSAGKIISRSLEKMDAREDQ